MFTYNRLNQLWTLLRLYSTGCMLMYDLLFRCVLKNHHLNCTWKIEMQRNTLRFVSQLTGMLLCNVHPSIIKYCCNTLAHVSIILRQTSISMESRTKYLLCNQSTLVSLKQYKAYRIQYNPDYWQRHKTCAINNVFCFVNANKLLVSNKLTAQYMVRQYYLNCS